MKFQSSKFQVNANILSARFKNEQLKKNAGNTHENFQTPLQTFASM